MDILGADNDQHKHAYYSPGYAATKPYNNRKRLKTKYIEKAALF